MGEKGKKNIKSDSTKSMQEKIIIDYHDYFFTSKNNKLAVKNLAEKSVSIGTFFFEYINGYNIPCSFIKKESSKSISFIRTDEIPIKIKIINSADSRTAKIFSIKIGSNLQLPIIEYHHGNQKETLISESHIISFNLCNYEELKIINRLCSKVNAIVKSFFERRNINLLELTCMFGKFEDKILLIGDFSPLSIKIDDIINVEKLPDPYKLETASLMNKYSIFLAKLING